MLHYAARTTPTLPTLPTTRTTPTVPTATAPASASEAPASASAACPTLLINVHSRFDLSYWHDEYTRQVAEKGEWVLRWKSNGRQFEHIVTDHDASTYSAVDMAAAVANLPPPRRIAGPGPGSGPGPEPAGSGATSTSTSTRTSTSTSSSSSTSSTTTTSETEAETEVLSVYGFVVADNLADSVGYDTRAVPTSDGVVPLADVAQVANRIQDGGSRSSSSKHMHKNKHTLVLLPGCSHYYREPGSKELLENAVIDWLSEPTRGLCVSIPGSKWHDVCRRRLGAKEVGQEEGRRSGGSRHVAKL